MRFRWLDYWSRPLLSSVSLRAFFRQPRPPDPLILQTDCGDFGWVSHPGTDGSFIVVADGFTLAKGAPHKEAALAWLKMVGSKEAKKPLTR